MPAMKLPPLRRILWLLTTVVLAIVFTLLTSTIAPAQTQPQRQSASKTPSQLSMQLGGLQVQDLESDLTPQELAQALVGQNISISNVAYTGTLAASGTFTGGADIMGFQGGILLTSGAATNVVGPNTSDNIGLNNGAPGDADLSALSGFQTYDAAILEFDFTPTENTVFFRFVFASDEYNEYVNSSYNDVFAFFVNGTNCATVEGDAVSINQINYGNPYGTSPNSHPELYINNDPSDGTAPHLTEMDGFTQVLTCSSPVTPDQTNHIKLAIADASDGVFDSAVFLEGESLTSESVIELTGLEVTQAVQDLTNDVELVQGKDTFVRAHVRSTTGTTIYNVKAKLIGRRNGVPLPGSPLTPQNIGGNIDVLASPDRGLLNQSFYFRLPPSWSSGEVEFEFVDITHDVNCKDVASTADDCKATVEFLDTPDVEVALIGIHWEDSGGTLHDPDIADYQAVVQDVEAELPIANLDWTRPYEMADWVDDGGPPQSSGGTWDLGDVISTLNNKRLLDGAGDRIYYGLLIDYQSGADLGLGYRPGSASAGFHRASDPTTAAHEIGHNLGRRHITCSGSEGSPDTGYPYTGGRISSATSGNNAYYGFHISTQRIFGPTTGDLMGYCRPRWISDYTYEAMRSAIDSRWRRPLLASAGTPSVLVAGTVETDGSAGTIDTIYQVDAPAAVELPEEGDYTLRFENEAGDVLASYQIAPSPLSEASENVMGFSHILPWEEGTTRIVLLYQDEELADTSASANAPIVSITSPTGDSLWKNDEETISWTASDEDGDTLTYAVQYSADGGATWNTLNPSWSSTTYIVNRTLIAGSDNAMVRVLASDGFHTGVDTSAPFQVANNAPEVTINDPVPGTIYVEDQMVFFSGVGYDAETGTLPDENLTWTSDLDGVLGSGSILTTSALSMTEGLHTITLEVTDDEGLSDSATTTVQIYRIRPTIAPEMVVSADAVQLTEQSEVSLNDTTPYTVSISNAGDGTIEWAAQSEAEWLYLEQSGVYTTQINGFTPSNFRIAVDTTGLSMGEYESTVVINATGNLSSSHVIDVVLNVYDVVEAAVSATPSSGIAPLEVSFANQSTGSFNSVEWEFGDGTTSSQGSPTHTYQDAGVYTATATVSGLGGTATDSVVIEVYEAVVAGFTASNTSGTAPLSVEFTNTSIGDFDSCSWDFGDGATSTSCNAVTHEFAEPGSYTVELTTSGLGGSDTFTTTIEVESGMSTLYLPLTR